MWSENYEKIIFLLIITIAISQELFAKINYYPWADLRFRYEYQHNFNIKSYGDKPVIGSKNDGFLLGRVRTGLKFNLSKNIILSLGVQHSLSWDTTLTNDDFYNKKFKIKNNPYKVYFEPFKTYLQIKNLFSIPLSLKIGRQLIYFGDHRIFGPGSWGNTGRWDWDAIKFSYKIKNDFISIYYGRTILHKFNQFSYNHRHGYESFGFYSSFLIITSPFKLKIEPFAMTKKDYHNNYKSEQGFYDDLNSYYYGARVVVKDFYNFVFDTTYIKQVGKYSKDDIDAYGYHFLIGYNLKNLLLDFEYTYGSGDNNHNDGKIKTFDGAFGALDAVLGRMNLFKWKNIEDYQFNLILKHFKIFYVKAQFHQFYLAKKRDAWYHNSKYYVDKTGNSGSRIGKEFDVECKCKIKKYFVIHTGYGHFWPGQFAKNVTNSDSGADWIFFQWEFKLN